MKVLYSGLIFMLAVISVTAQVPQGFNYQAVARNAAGEPIANISLQVKVAITSDASGTQYVWEEQHNVTTSPNGVFSLVVGNPAATFVQGSAASFSAINWSAAPLYIKTSINYPSSWQSLGTTQLWSVPYSMLASKSVDFAGTFNFDGDTIVILKSVSIGSDDAGKALLAVTSLDDTSDDPLFEVKRKDGQTVFAVYNDAVNIYVPTAPGKSSKGGFAIGSFDEARKGFSQDYFRVTPDSVRIYINNDPNFTKGSASKGGFAIGGFDDAKGITKTFLNVTAASTVDTVGSRAQILWYPKKEAFLAGRVHIGSADSVGQNSTALGYHSIAMGNWSQAFGYKAKALRPYSTAFGNNAVASGDDSYAFGSGAEASGLRSFALGSVGVDESGNSTSRKTIASGAYTVAIGMGAQAITGSAAMAMGTNSTASGFASTSIGYYSTASNYYAVAIGYYSQASNRYAHAFGLSATASAEGSLALGMYSTASGNHASSMGYRSEATKPYSVAIGYFAKAQGDYSGAFGRSAQATGNNSVAVGYGVIASGLDASAFGKSATATGQGGLAMGVSSVAAGLNSVSIGYSTDATNSYSVAMGYDAQSTGTYSMALGYTANASNSYSTAIGFNPAASGTYSTAIGVNAASAGTYSTAMGYGTSSEGSYSIALGMNSSSTGSYATALGYSARAYGDKSLALGSHYNYTYYRMVFNKITGKFTLMPVTINKYNTAIRQFSVAIGNGNLAEDGGLALGTNNSALSSGSVALGHSNVADTTYSFAAGFENTATGLNAFALGANVTAQASNSFVIGTYNTITGNKFDWIETDPLFVVGNGESGTLHDAFRINKNGGTYIYPESAQYGLYVYNYNTTRTATTYGIRSKVYSTQDAVVYSGYFYGSTGGVESNYQGLFADKRTGDLTDVAEYIYDSYGNTEAADVVVADPNKKESVIKSSMPYQASVLGVISTRPHLTLGMELVIDEATGEPLEGVMATRLTLTGRVPVKVTAENGPIKPGDMLTTSSTPGHAMKWTLLDVNSASSFEEMKSILSENERRRNAVIGKAVEAHNSGTGTVMVLVSLQ